MTREDKAKALLVIVTGMLVFYFIFKKEWLLYIGLFVGLAGVFVPFLGDLIVKGWYKLAELLGYINSRILLTVIFFLILFPVAVLARLGRGKNMLGLRKDPNQTAFTERNHRYVAKDLKNVW
ncbi:MAG: SxtJ family membrane protein [Spirosomataceae bacterium]